MTTKNKFYLSVSISILLGVVLIVFLVQPIYVDIKTNSEELILEKQTLASLETKIRNINNFRDNYQETKDNLDKIKNLFINSKAPINFIYFLEKSAQVSQIPIEISPSQLKEDKESIWPYIVFKINSACPFPNFLRFLDKLESSPYLIETNELSINRLTEEELRKEDFKNNSLGDVKISLSIRVFAN